MIFCVDTDNINQSSYYFCCLFMRTNHTNGKKIYFRGTVSSLFNAGISCSDYMKNASTKNKQFLLCAQTCKRSLMPATGRFSCRSRIAACTIISAWVSISPKASASSITSFITFLCSATSFSKRRAHMNSKNTIEKTLQNLLPFLRSHFHTKKLQKIWHYRFHF